MSDTNLLPKEELESIQLYTTTFEPKIDRRFITYFTNSKGPILPSFVVYAIDRPKCSVKKSEFDGKNKINWEPITAKLYDPIVPSSAQAIFHNIIDGELFKLVVDVLGPIGDKVEEWEFTGCRFSHIDFGTMDWRNMENGEIDFVTTKRSVSGKPLFINVEIQFESVVLNY